MSHPRLRWCEVWVESPEVEVELPEVEVVSVLGGVT